MLTSENDCEKFSFFTKSIIHLSFSRIRLSARANSLEAADQLPPDSVLSASVFSRRFIMAWFLGRSSQRSSKSHDTVSFAAHADSPCNVNVSMYSHTLLHLIEADYLLFTYKDVF